MNNLPSDGDWVRVFTGSPIDAEMTRGVLGGSGIDAVIKRLGGGAYGLDPGPLGETAVFVRTGDLAIARELLGEEPPVAPDDSQSADREQSSALLLGGKWILRAVVILTIAALLLEVAP